MITIQKMFFSGIICLFAIGGVSAAPNDTTFINQWFGDTLFNDSSFNDRWSIDSLLNDSSFIGRWSRDSILNDSSFIGRWSGDSLFNDSSFWNQWLDSLLNDSSFLDQWLGDTSFFRRSPVLKGASVSNVISDRATSIKVFNINGKIVKQYSKDIVSISEFTRSLSLQTSQPLIVQWMEVGSGGKMQSKMIMPLR